jgi:hypothetical protein
LAMTDPFESALWWFMWFPSRRLHCLDMSASVCSLKLPHPSNSLYSVIYFFKQWMIFCATRMKL